MLETVVTVARETSKTGIDVSLAVVEAVDEDDQPCVFRVLGYDSRLGQVFNNLIDNARSFSEPGGSVRVAISVVRDGGSGRKGFEVVIDDDGPGIPADAFERIFERFYTDRPNQGFGQNSGLGLSISRQIIEAHGGRIRAANRLAASAPAGGAPAVLGARFTVWLPALADVD